MGVISDYLKRFVARAQPRRVAFDPVRADADGLSIGGERLAWGDIVRLDAYKRDIFVGDFLCLAVLARDGRAFEINEESPGWQEAGVAIERYLPGAVAHAEWTLRLIASEFGEVVAVYRVPEVS